MSKKGRRTILVRIIGFLIVFSLLLLGLKLYSSGIDKVNIALKIVKVCENCSIKVNENGTTIQKSSTDVYSYTTIVSRTSKGITLNDNINKVIDLYKITANEAVWKAKVLNESSNLEEKEILYTTDDQNINSKTQFYFIYGKKDGKWRLIDLNKDYKAYNNILVYTFYLNKGKINSFEIKHIKE